MNTDRLTPELVRLIHSVLDEEAPLREWQEAAVELAAHWRQSGYAPQDLLCLLTGIEPAPWKRVRCFLPKHRGRTWGQIVVDDPCYILWLRDNHQDPALREFLTDVALRAGLTGPGVPTRTSPRGPAMDVEEEPVNEAQRIRKRSNLAANLNEEAAQERERGEDDTQPTRE